MSSRPLGGLTVVNLTSGIPGAYAARLLVDAGAAATTVEPPEGDPIRRRSASGDPSSEDSTLYRFLHQGMQEISHDADLEALLDAADVVLVGLGAEGGAVVRAGARRQQVVVAITPYGLLGPCSARPSSDLVLQAESGSLATRGRVEQPPLMAGGRTMEWIAGAFGATAGLAAWRRRQRTGRGELVDVSVLEVAHLAGTAYSPLGYELAGRPPITVPARIVEAPEIHPTKDGWVGFTTNSAQQLQDFMILIDRSDLLADEELASMPGRQARYHEWTAIVEGWTSVRSTEEVVLAASALRIPCAPVLDAAGVLELPLFRERNIFRRSLDGDFLHPRRPWLLDGSCDAPDPEAGPRTSERRTETPLPPGGDPLPLDGVRVLDMTAWWAGPGATHLLATLGADVVHLESTSRLDGMRLTGGAFRALGRWWERSSFFLSVNSNKRDLTLDIDTPAGREALERLIRRSDVLVENFTPRVLDNLGLSWERLQELNPRLSVVRMPAFGLDGSWRDRPGFAQTMEQLSGLAWLTGWADGQPRNQRGPSDLNSGAHAAFAAMCALEARAQDGVGHLVEVPFIEVALNAAAEQTVEHSSNGTVQARDGNRSPVAAPQGIYPCQGVEQWLALSVETDEQWEGLRDALGRPAWADDPALADQSGRRAAHDQIDEHLANWAGEQQLADAVELLVARGIPAGRVRDPRLSGEHEQFEARRFREAVPHPVVGALPVTTVPFRFESVRSWLRSPAPTLGEHNHEILAELGYDQEQIAALEAADVIGTEPLRL
jgi:crotonobetainyl-CoA:carnitine CoA-transferase CaiB-like acyl-CoA transferase